MSTDAQEEPRLLSPLPSLIGPSTIIIIMPVKMLGIGLNGNTNASRSAWRLWRNTENVFVRLALEFSSQEPGSPNHKTHVTESFIFYFLKWVAHFFRKLFTWPSWSQQQNITLFKFYIIMGRIQYFTSSFFLRHLLIYLLLHWCS